MDTAAFKKEMATLTIKQRDSAGPLAQKNYNDDKYPGYDASSEKNYSNTISKGKLFYFDPNTITAADWQRLGVRDKTIGTIEKYLAKGGHFYKPEDMGKIWGLHPDEVQRLLPYVQIAAKENAYPQKNYEAKSYEPSRKSFPIIDINTADTTALIALPGIGSKLAQRIIAFREKLGGFYAVAQLAETFGLPDSTFQKIKPRLMVDAALIKQVNINTATLEEMKSHPYIRYTIANAIVQYRTQHGHFATIADVKKIMIVTEELFTKAAPYLTVE